MIILLNFEILGEMDPNARHPDAVPAANAQSRPAASHNNENIEPKKESIQQTKNTNPASNAKSFFNNKDTPKQPLSTSSNNQPGMFNNFKVFGISSLNPYQNKWSIKARVTNKSAIRTYSNAKGEGRLFNVEFIDNTGEIRASGFNEQCDKFYELLQIDKVSLNDLLMINQMF